MVSPHFTVDVPPQPWTGRFDGDGAEHRRWWQAVGAYSASAFPRTAFRPSGTPGGGPGAADPAPRGDGLPGARRRPRLRQRRRRAPQQGPHRRRCRPRRHPRRARPARLPPGPVGARRRRRHRGGGRAWKPGRRGPDWPSRRCSTPARFPWCWAAATRRRSPATSGVAGSAAVREGLRVGVLNLDAHFDLRDEPVPSSGTPFLQMARAEAAAGRELQVRRRRNLRTEQHPRAVPDRRRAGRGLSAGRGLLGGGAPAASWPPSWRRWTRCT